MLVDKKECTGCRACEQVCKQKCITMEKDEFGFLYPKVNKNLCINCGLCQNVCHALSIDKQKRASDKEKPNAYYGWVKNSKLRKDSSSGGAFSSIVNSWLDSNGVVFGAAFNTDFSYVEHRCFNKEQYQPLRKSKYVFSDTNTSFSEVLKLLKDNKKVIYSGTPCQIGALKTFLSKDYDNLLTIDFICHGVPSISFLNEHVKYITDKSNVLNIDFRSKAMGWKPHCLKVEYENGTYLKHFNDDFYMFAFINNLILRECCYNCKYSEEKHVSDLTIADFWGITNTKPEVDDNLGISLIVFNNENKRKELLPLLNTEMVLSSVSFDDYKYIYKTHLSYNLDKRNKTLKLIREKGFAYLSKRWEKYKTFYKLNILLNKIKNII